MRLLFLDFDGVLGPGSFSIYDNDPRGLEAKAQVRRIISETDCHIIVSSTWRKYVEISELAEYLCKAGVISCPSKVVGKTPIIGWRGDEIVTWLKHSNIHVTSFAILDDKEYAIRRGKDYRYSRKSSYIDFDLADRFVRTDPNFGCMRDDADQVIKILRGKS